MKMFFSFGHILFILLFYSLSLIYTTKIYLELIILFPLGPVIPSHYIKFHCYSDDTQFYVPV